MLQQYPLYAYIPARDLERARRFYEGKLGFVPKQESNGGVVYEFGCSTACFLYPTPSAGTSQASQAFWAVADIDSEIADLKARGVTFEDFDMPGERSPAGVVIAGGAKAAWFRDSEGNIMALIESVADPRSRPEQQVVFPQDPEGNPLTSPVAAASIGLPLKGSSRGRSC